MSFKSGIQYYNRRSEPLLVRETEVLEWKIKCGSYLSVVQLQSQTPAKTLKKKEMFSLLNYILTQLTQ